MRTLFLLALAFTSQATTITADLDLSSYSRSLQRRHPGEIAAPNFHVFILPGTGSGSLHIESLDAAIRTPTLTLTEETVKHSSGGVISYYQALFGILEYDAGLARDLWATGMARLVLDVDGAVSSPRSIGSHQPTTGGTWGTGITFRNWTVNDSPEVHAPEPSSFLLLGALFLFSGHIRRKGAVLNQ